jgi:hypothetical protein
MIDQQRGFAGFDSLVSDLSDLPLHVEPVPPPISANKPDPIGDPPAWAVKNASGGSDMLAAIIISIFVILILFLLADDQLSPIAPTGPITHVPPPPETTPARPAPPSQPTIRPLPLPSPPSIPADEPEELKPPVGTDRALTTNQVRYCAFQGVRIDGARSVIDDRSQYEIDRFNALISDYNGRCGSYRYQEGALARARAEADARRTSLEEEGSTAFLAGRVRTPAPSVQLVAPKPQTSENTALSPPIPENAELDAAGRWVCKSGYRQLEAECVVISSPANARLDFTGQAWTCLRGFFQSGNECLRIRIPANADLDNTGKGWRCNPGFRQIGQSCLKF